MRHNLPAQGAMVVLACGWLASAAAAGQLPQELVSQYRPAVERLREAYTRISVEGISRMALPQQGKMREQQFVMRANDKLRRLDTTTVRQQRMGLQVGAKEMQMATPWGSLSTFTKPGGEFFNDARQIPYDDVVSQIDRDSLLNYPYSLGSEGTILDMLLRPDVKVLSVKRSSTSGQVQIGFEQNARHAGHTGVWQSALVLSPADGWALVSFRRTLGQGSNQVVQQGKLSYSGSEDGIPLVQTIVSETTVGGKITRQESIEASQVDLGKPDRFYFDSFSF